MTDFDTIAASWDNNPIHRDRSLAIAKEITNRIPLCKQWKALEFGAGTGILSFILKDQLKEIYMMDNSAEMINVIQEKTDALPDTHLHAVLFDMEQQDYAAGKFNLLLTQMALHHIENIPLMINKFYDLTEPEGYIAIADLYSEDGSFHGTGFHGHNGFDPNRLSQQLLSAGFRNPVCKECFVIHKTVDNGEPKAFPVFLLIAQK